MKIFKSLTCLLAIVLVSACNGQSSATFSSSSIEQSSLMSSSQEESFSSDSSIISSKEETHSYYNGYYDSLVSWTDGENLKSQLNKIIRNGYQPLSYTKSSKQNYDTNIHADHSKNDFEYLDVVYSNKHNFKTETNKGWQREHAWCASLMCGSETSKAVAFKGRATDFHNLFAANASGNQSRGNKNYGYADVFSTKYVTDYMTDDGNDGYSYDEETFEPGDIDKGRLARAIFYMATMYKDEEVDTANNITMKGLTIVEDPVTYVAGNNCKFAIGNLVDLLEWNEDYQVDYLEMQHNIAVFSDKDNPDGYAQGNRNPYVDYPGLVDYVYGSKKNQAGTLKDVVASASYLDCEDSVLSHYAIKEAKREYGYGQTLTPNDYTVVGVHKDYSYSVETADILNSLDNHTFEESDGDEVSAVIATMINTISYKIILNPLEFCSSGKIVITPDGISKDSNGVDQSVTYGDYGFIFNYSSSSSGSMRIDNIWSNGSGSEKLGMTIGSGTKVLTGLTIKTQESYMIDRVYMRVKAGNASSSFTLKIYVGETNVFSGTVNDNNKYKVFGTELSEPLSGQISFVLQGSNCLQINSIAFNSIIA